MHQVVFFLSRIDISVKLTGLSVISVNKPVTMVNVELKFANKKLH
jgi:hypothetical protein